VVNSDALRLMQRLLLLALLLSGFFIITHSRPAASAANALPSCSECDRHFSMCTHACASAPDPNACYGDCYEDPYITNCYATCTRNSGNPVCTDDFECYSGVCDSSHHCTSFP